MHDTAPSHSEAGFGEAGSKIPVASRFKSCCFVYDPSEISRSFLFCVGLNALRTSHPSTVLLPQYEKRRGPSTVV